MSQLAPNNDPRLTPRMAAVLQKIGQAQLGKPYMYELSAVEARAVYARGAEVLDLPRAPLALVQDTTCAARDGAQIPARLYAPRDAHPYQPLPVLLYFHGGGFTVGSIETHDSLCRQLALLADCAVLSVQYRLAPEARFPTAAHDAFDALAALAGGNWLPGLDARNIAVGGDSAGGTLAAAAAIWAQQERIPLKLQLLFYPGLAAHQELPAHAEFAQGYLIEKPHINWFFKQYIEPLDCTDWRFSPLQHADVSGLAPAWIGVAELDPIRDDGLAWAAKLRAAGVDAETVVYAGVVHDFIKMGRSLPEAGQAHAAAAAALRRAFDV